MPNTNAAPNAEFAPRAYRYELNAEGRRLQAQARATGQLPWFPEEHHILTDEEGRPIPARRPRDAYDRARRVGPAPRPAPLRDLMRGVPYAPVGGVERGEEDRRGRRTLVPETPALARARRLQRNNEPVIPKTGIKRDICVIARERIGSNPRLEAGVVELVRAFLEDRLDESLTVAQRISTRAKRLTTRRVDYIVGRQMRGIGC